MTTRDEPFLDLNLEIVQNSSISACLRNFSATETLCGDSKYFCATCCSQQEAQKRWVSSHRATQLYRSPAPSPSPVHARPCLANSMRIKQLPNMLAVHLKRFARGEIKLSWRVAHPTELRLFNSVRDCVAAAGVIVSFDISHPALSNIALKTNDAPDPDRIYDLVGAVIHIGRQMSSGHYISVVRTQGHWLMFDDEIVTVGAVWTFWPSQASPASTANNPNPKPLNR